MKTKASIFQKHHRKRQIIAQYMLSVALIFLLSLASLLVLRHILQQQQDYTDLINISSRQCLLSQQIILLAHEIEGNRKESKTASLKEQIDYSINLMAQSHQRLISGKAMDGTGVELNDTLSTMFFQSPLEVDRLVTEYLADISAIVTKPVSEKSYEELASLSINARGILLTGLNKIAQQYEAESVSYSTTLKNGALAIFLLMVLLLAIIMVFGVRSMAEMVADNEGMLPSILDSIPSLTDIISNKGTILYQSQHLIARLGEATIGQKCFEVYKTDKKKCDSCPVFSNHGGESSDNKISACFDKLSAGSVVKTTHLPILYKGHEAIFHTFNDITEQTMSEAFFIKAKEEADQASELKSTFLTNMSHEIRTPMNAIIGFTDLALETELNSQQRDYLEKIHHSSNSLMKTMNDILSSSNVGAGKFIMEEKTFSLNQVIEHTASLFANKAQEKDIQLLTKQQPGIPPFLVGDSLRLQQILVNLLANSIKFTDEGEITVQVNIESINDQQTELRFSVADTGIGISEDRLATLFDSFYQTDSSTTKKSAGTGLGLAICKQLVELMGGKIDVDSVEGQGSVFSFSVPFALIGGDDNSNLGQLIDKDVFASINKLSAKPDIDTKKSITRIKGAHILLVEDNPINCQVAEEILAKADIFVDTVSHGKHALDRIIKEKSEYDAILMDIQMPVMGGVECTSELRKMSSQRKHERLPVVAMTANALPGDREKYLQAGMDDYITKPINRTELFSVLARWIPEDRALRRVRPDLLNRRHGRDRRGDYNNRRNNPKDRREIKAEFSLPDNLPGIDLAQGLGRVEGNTMLYIRLLEMFVEDYTSIGQEIQTAIDDNDLESAARLVHTVKGVAGSIGAQRLATAAQALEESTKNEAQIDQKVAQFKEALEQILSSLATLPNIAQHLDTTDKKKHLMGDGKMLSILTELQTMLAERNFEADSKWRELQPLLHTVPDKKRYILDDAISNFEFERALEILLEIKQVNGECIVAEK